MARLIAADEKNGLNVDSGHFKWVLCSLLLSPSDHHGAGAIRFSASAAPDFAECALCLDAIAHRSVAPLPLVPHPQQGRMCLLVRNRTAQRGEHEELTESLSR
jgi:hypothetical protein